MLFSIVFALVTAWVSPAAASDFFCAPIFAEVSELSNPLPEDGIFARVVSASNAEKILSGERMLSHEGTFEKETFITAYEDIADIEDASEYAVRLALYEDPEGTRLKDTSDWVVIKFQFSGEYPTSLRSPSEHARRIRGYGFLRGGKTGGGAREWLIDNDLYEKGQIVFVP